MQHLLLLLLLVPMCVGVITTQAHAERPLEEEEMKTEKALEKEEGE